MAVRKRLVRQAGRETERCCCQCHVNLKKRQVLASFMAGKAGPRQARLFFLQNQDEFRVDASKNLNHIGAFQNTARIHLHIWLNRGRQFGEQTRVLPAFAPRT